jgi:hypothetical protein
MAILLSHTLSSDCDFVNHKLIITNSFNDILERRISNMNIYIYSFIISRFTHSSKDIFGKTDHEYVYNTEIYFAVCKSIDHKYI